MHTVKRKEIELDVNPVLHIPASVSEQIRYLHAQVGKVEWSGFLMCKIKGNIKNIDDLSVEVEHIYPCNVGTVASTDYEPADHLMEVWDKFPEYNFMLDNPWDGKAKNDGKKICQIHTHHALEGGAYFSGVDMGDLHDNVSAHGLYISLIVAMDGKYVAKGAMLATSVTTSTIKLNDFEGINIKTKNEEEQLVTFDFDITFDTPLYLVNKTKEIIIESQLRKKPVYTPNKPYTHYKKAPKINTTKTDDSGFESEYIPGFGNFYKDPDTNLMYSESGEIITSQEMREMRELSSL